MRPHLLFALLAACSWSTPSEMPPITGELQPLAPIPPLEQAWTWNTPDWTSLPPVVVDERCLGGAVPRERKPKPPPLRSPRPSPAPSAPAPTPMATPPAPQGASGADRPSPAEIENLKALGYYSPEEEGRAGGSFDAGGAAKGKAEDKADRAAPAGPPVSGAAAPAAAPAPSPAPAPAPAREAREIPGDVPPSFAPPPPPRPLPPRQRIDWGGVVHLSNDDAMSLASAQRLLWALDKRQPFTLDQIRKHELLNYFSFDLPAAATGGDSPFTVAASGERVDGDTLGVAIAVRGAAPPRPPVDLTLLVDRSGSMGGEGRMDYTHRALQLGAGRLHAGDRVDLVLFDHEACTAVRDFVVGRDDPGLLAGAIARVQPRGSTNLDAGLREAYRVAASHAAPAGQTRAGRVMVVTDAILNTGQVDPNVVSEVGRHLDERGIRLTGVGVGSEFRDDVLNQLTEKGKGAYVFLGSDKVVDRMFGAGFEALIHTVAEDVRFALDLPDGLGMERFYGEEASTDPTAVQPVSFQAGASQVFFEDLAIRDGQLDPGAPLRFTIGWTDPVSGARRSQVFDTTVGAVLANDPRNARKARALMAWSDVLTAHAMRGDACGAPLASFRAAGLGVQDDAELAYIDKLIGGLCAGRGDLPAPLPTPTFASTRIRLDSDQPIGSVELRCNGQRQTRSLSTSDTIATFQAPAGRCEVTLFGAVPMVGTIDVAPTGSDVRCVVRGGRATCG